jgi:hypothetical protein
MVTEYLPDAHRLLIVTLMTRAMVAIENDPEMRTETQECRDIIRRLSGTDTRVTVERAYASGVKP